MATQIAPTPVLRGEEALKVIQEAKRKPSQKTQRAFEMLDTEFLRMTVKSTENDY